MTSFMTIAEIDERILVESNRLQIADRQFIYQFLSGAQYKTNDVNGKRMILLDESIEFCPNRAYYLNQILFEANLSTNHWRKLKRKKRIETKSSERRDLVYLDCFR